MRWWTQRPNGCRTAPGDRRIVRRPSDQGERAESAAAVTRGVESVIDPLQSNQTELARERLEHRAGLGRFKKRVEVVQSPQRVAAGSVGTVFESPGR